MKSTIWHLEMTSPGELAAVEVDARLELQEEEKAATSARLYREIGAAWRWRDRLVWSDRDWEDRVLRDEVWSWQVRCEGEEAGWVEIERQGGGSVEIVYFGLLPRWIGQGLGGGLLTLVVRRAWGITGARRVWLHTCSEDHPGALANYRKRGFRLFKTEVKEISN